MSHVNKVLPVPPFPFIGSFYNKHKILCLEFRAQQGREEKVRTETPESNKREMFSNILILKLMANVQGLVPCRDQQSLAMASLPLNDLATCLWSQGCRDSPDMFSRSPPKANLVMGGKWKKR